MNSRPLQFYYLTLVILLAQLLLGYGFEVDRKDDCFMACSLAPNGFKCRTCASSRKNRLPMRFGKRNNLATRLGDIRHINDIMAETEERTNRKIGSGSDKRTASPLLWAYQTLPSDTLEYRSAIPGQDKKDLTVFPDMYF
ncbi:hypothetical protein RvY_09211 [Ramazzottius varieornatus]|uniref:Uncharacterized protein n=1 Tax=Ramazzottius varieornatus TaxID=947166 RepID=A0A1D1VE40_RAMVA|nr:hypothetical protein RvY_09211 [Ramazzottius varieornatus]